MDHPQIPVRLPPITHLTQHSPLSSSTGSQHQHQPGHSNLFPTSYSSPLLCCPKHIQCTSIAIPPHSKNEMVPSASASDLINRAAHVDNQLKHLSTLLAMYPLRLLHEYQRLGPTDSAHSLEALADIPADTINASVESCKEILTFFEQWTKLKEQRSQPESWSSEDTQRPAFESVATRRMETNPRAVQVPRTITSLSQSYNAASTFSQPSLYGTQGSLPVLQSTCTAPSGVPGTSVNLPSAVTTLPSLPMTLPQYHTTATNARGGPANSTSMSSVSSVSSVSSGSSISMASAVLPRSYSEPHTPSLSPKTTTTPDSQTMLTDNIVLLTTPVARKTRKTDRETGKPLVCQRCGIKDTPEWRRGPNGARTLCNACGLFHAKLLKKKGKKAASNVLNYQTQFSKAPGIRRISGNIITETINKSDNK